MECGIKKQKGDMTQRWQLAADASNSRGGCILLPNWVPSDQSGEKICRMYSSEICFCSVYPHNPISDWFDRLTHTETYCRLGLFLP